jgi:hypothetical protein
MGLHIASALLACAGAAPITYQHFVEIQLATARTKDGPAVTTHRPTDVVGKLSIKPGPLLGITHALRFDKT